MNDIDVLPRQKVGVVLVSVNAKCFCERVELLTIRPGRRDQLSAGIFGQRAPEVIGRIPVTEAENCDAIFASHECSGNEFPVSSSQLPVGFELPGSSSRLPRCEQLPSFHHSYHTERGNWRPETGNWQLTDKMSVSRTPDESNQSDRRHRRCSDLHRHSCRGSTVAEETAQGIHQFIQWEGSQRVAWPAAKL